MSMGRGLTVLVFLSMLAGWAWLSMQEPLQSFDRWAMLLFRDEHQQPIGGDATVTAVLFITRAGDGTTLFVLSLAMLIQLFRKGHRMLCMNGALAVIGLYLLSPVLKILFARPRPDLLEHLVRVSGNSFPSGHALRSAGVYLVLALLMSNVVGGRTKPFLVSAAIMISTCVALSRVYLGVHWPSDIIAGWIIAAGWLAFWWDRLNDRRPG
jgi:undecaprenyl-diphosphatase